MNTMLMMLGPVLPAEWTPATIITLIKDVIIAILDIPKAIIAWALGEPLIATMLICIIAFGFLYRSKKLIPGMK